MALKKHTNRATARLPGETDEQWTTRNARLERNAYGKWVIKYTEIVTLTDGTADHRTMERSTKETDQTEARKFFNDWCVMYVARGQANRSGHTFQDVADDYRQVTRARRYCRTNDYVAKQLCEFLGTDPADTIDTRRMGELRDWLERNGKAPGTVRNYLSVALTLLHHAEHQGMIPANSTPKYKMPPTPPSRSWSLNEDQRESVFAAAAAWGQDTGNPVKLRIGLFVCIALETAQRRDAILQLTWDRINLTETLRGTLKAKKIDFRKPGHTPLNKKRCAAAPISPDLMVVLRRAALRAPTNKAGEPTGPVIACSRILEGFHVFRDALGMPDWFTPHVFRHTWVTLAWNRVPLTHISFMTGDTISTLQRIYAHLDADVSEQAFEEHLWSRRNPYKDAA